MALVILQGKLYKVRMQNLRGHHKNPHEPEFQVSYEISGDVFQVKGEYQGPFHVNREFSEDGFENWGLWEFDVFELFLTRDDKCGHYLEIQFSPLSQKLALLIKKPREDFEYFAPQTFCLNSVFEGEYWRFDCSVKASDIPGDSNILKGNLHSCLFKSEERCYLGLGLNKEEKPDFHRPDLFLNLGVFNG